MNNSLIAHCLPLTFHQFQKIHYGQPHEEHAKRNSLAARKIVAIDLGKGLATLALKISFYSIFNLVLLIAKLGETLFHLIVSLRSRDHRHAFKATLLESCDYALLLCIYPVIEVANIIKLALALIIYPKLHFKLPQKTSIKEQAYYFQSKCHQKFNWLLNFFLADSSYNTKLRILQTQMKLKERNLTTDKDKVDFFTKLDSLLKKFQEVQNEETYRALSLFFNESNGEYSDLSNNQKDLVLL